MPPTPRPPSLRQRHTAVTRDAILQAARRLFARQGFAATTVRPIAAEAGVAVQTLYSAFGSKQGLLLALVDSIRDHTDARQLWDRVASAENASDAIALAARIRRQVLERCGDIVTTFREGAAVDREVAAAYDEGQRRSRDGIARLCERLDALGALGPGLTARRAEDQVAALFSAEVYEELTGSRSGWSPDEYEEWLAAQIASAIAA